MRRLPGAVRFLLLFLLLSFSSAALLQAQQPRITIHPTSVGQTPQPEEFGVQDQSVYNLNPSDFFAEIPDSRQMLWDFFVAPATTVSSVDLTAPVHIPSGVLLTSLTVYYRDNDPLTDPTDAYFLIGSDTGGAGAYGVTFPTGAPGDTSATMNFPTNVPPVNNGSYHYGFRITLHRSNTTDDQEIYRVAIRYKRQVSPAPATATFNDVPTTHLFYQYIEALAAAGVTAGCGGGNFCPDAPLTRGQMAVFLSKALGLHWPN